MANPNSRLCGLCDLCVRIYGRRLRLPRTPFGKGGLRGLCGLCVRFKLRELRGLRVGFRRTRRGRGEDADVGLEELEGVADEGDGVWLSTRIAPPCGNHGTGCLLSSSIACGMAFGLPMLESIRCAKERLSDALARGLSLGHGNSPVDFR